MSNSIERMQEIYDNTYESIENYNYYDEIKNAYVDLYISFSTGKILDAGCGEGIHLKRALKNGYDIFGIELSKVCCNNYLTGIPHENTDIISHANDGNVYNQIICMDVLEHIPYEFVDETARHLMQMGDSILLGIANHTDNINGVELHLIREKASWWETLLKKFYEHVDIITSMYSDTFFIIECSNNSDQTVGKKKAFQALNTINSYYITGLMQLL